MNGYKRLTVFFARKAKSGTCLDILSLINELEKENEMLSKSDTSKEESSIEYYNLYKDFKRENQQLKDRIAELEDKIENGTLVEFNKPFYSNQFNSWCIFLREGDYIKSLCLTKKQAEEYQKKLQEKQE